MDGAAGVRLRRAGSGGVLAEVADGATAERLAAALVAAPPPGAVDLVPAARTVLVRFDPWTARRDDVERAVLAAASAPLPQAQRGGVGAVVVDVLYDGDDLDDVARFTGLSAEEVVRRHTAREYRVAFTGFTPGFGYLTGGDPALRVPRRSTPRTAVPAGSVGLAGEHSGVYPRTSPGGWQLVGRTGAVLWDVERDPPALLRTGAAVRFRAVRDLVVAPLPRTTTPPALPAAVVEGLEVVATGPLALLVDDGRDGHADLGVGPSGAADRASARTANACAGNPREAVCVEVLLGGLEVRARGAVTVAVAGAPCALERDGVAVTGPVVALDDGDHLRLGAPPQGLRTYLALRGGVAAPAFLGSASTDTLSGLGPPPLRAGQVLGVAGLRAGSVTDEASPTALPPTVSSVSTGAGSAGSAGSAGRAGGAAVLRVLSGPRDDAVGTGLLDGEWLVAPRSDRIGTRLVRPPGSPHGPLQHLDGPAGPAGPGGRGGGGGGQLPSEGTVRGALQVPPDGQPVLFGPDRPVTGGYPVVAVVVGADLDATGQLPPGTRVRFTAA